MQVACPHSQPFAHPHLTTCALGLGNGHPSRGVCELACKLGTQQHRVLLPAEYQSTPEGALRRARQMYPAPTPMQLATMRAEAAGLPLPGPAAPDPTSPLISRRVALALPVCGACPAYGGLAAERVIRCGDAPGCCGGPRLLSLSWGSCPRQSWPAEVSKLDREALNF